MSEQESLYVIVAKGWYCNASLTIVACSQEVELLPLLPVARRLYCYHCCL